MSPDHSPIDSTGTTIPQTIQRTDLQAVTPDHLAGDLDYQIYSEFASFTHRGRTCNVDNLLSSLSAALDIRSVDVGKTDDPARFSENEAVDIVIETLESKYPAWFGDEGALKDLNQPVSNVILSEDRLKEQWFQGRLESQLTPIEGDHWQDHKRVLVPFGAIFLTAVREQYRADKQAQREHGRRKIKRSVMEHIHRNNLRADDVEVAVQDALRRMGEVD